jgi:hypothetical protein
VDETTMTINETRLDIARIKFRLEFHEALLVRMRVFQLLQPVSPLLAPEQEIRAAQDSVLREIEEISSAVENLFLRQLSLSDAEKALYADEIREIAENMKSYVNPHGH